MKKIEDFDLICGSHNQGQIETSFDNLVEAFGKPHDEGDGYKTNAEWQFITNDGVVFTLYNWKNGLTYGGLPVENITVWNIGGFDECAVKAVKERLNMCKPDYRNY